MEKVKATVLTKRIKKRFLCEDHYMIGFSFHDIYNTKNSSNTKEIRVSYIAYEDLKIGDIVECPMKINNNGLLSFDFSQPLQKI